MDGVKTMSKRGRPSKKEIEQKIIEGAASGPHKYKCVLCKRTFPRQKSLNTHLKAHKGERCHFCTFPECSSKGFVQTGQLKTHIGTHTKEKPYKCLIPECRIRFLHGARICGLHKTRVFQDGEIFFDEIESNLTPEQKEWIKNKQKEITDRKKMQLAKRRRASTSSASSSKVKLTSANTSRADPCSASTSTAGPSSTRMSREDPRTANISGEAPSSASTSRVGSYFASRKRRSSPCLDSTSRAGPYSASTKRRLSPCSRSTSRPRAFSNLEFMNGLNDNKENNQPRNSVIVPNYNYFPHTNRSGIRSDLYPLLSRRLSNLTLVNDTQHSDEPKTNNCPPLTEQLPRVNEDENKMEVEDASSSGSERGYVHQDQNHTNDRTDAAIALASLSLPRQP